MLCKGCGKVQAACKCPKTPEERLRRSKVLPPVIDRLATSEIAESGRQRRVILKDSKQRDQAARNRENLQGVRRRK